MRGERVRAVVYIDEALLAQLKVALAIDGLSMSEWFRSHAQTYVQSKSGVQFDRLMQPVAHGH